MQSKCLSQGEAEETTPPRGEGAVKTGLRHWKTLALKTGATGPQASERQLPPQLEQVRGGLSPVYSLWRERDC